MKYSSSHALNCFASSRPCRRHGEKHWSERRELVTGYTCYKIVLLIFRTLPPTLMRILALPVSFFYFLFAGKARAASKKFLRRVKPQCDAPKKIFLNPLKHFAAFSLTIVEKIQGWGGKIQFENIHFQRDDIDNLVYELENGRGALLICSHLGNAELLRALASYDRTGVSRSVPVISIVDFSCNAYFNRMLRELNPDSMMHIISADDVGPETIIQLQEQIAGGGLVVIAGDRTSANTRDRYLTIPFLGFDAPFAYGPYLLASLLNASVYFVFALRTKDAGIFPEYDMHVHKNQISFDCQRKERETRIRSTAENFVHYLEYYSRKYPCQWYNFFDFWAFPETLI
ncbi:MAG: hypothetical protein NC041_00805 [Bacteroides sp.]|nr:hypothetical protein [Prevotella sp.]MCM1408017.1 hypothetical protein [Treponema brennaborense]MCM1468993.1 hypothetical protein [Bacteroides sp.]